MLTTIQILEPFSKGSVCPPELYERTVPKSDVKQLKIVIRLYMRQLAKYEKWSNDSYEEMSAWGAPTEDFAEDGYFDTDRNAYADIVKLFPKLAAKYFVGFSPKYGKQAPHGMGRYDRYGGL